MDILKPELVWIGGRCYRVNPTVHSDEDIVSKPSNQYIEEGIAHRLLCVLSDITAQTVFFRSVW